MLFVEERVAIFPLPQREVELSVWKIVLVNFSYHIEVDGRYYSASFVYNKHRVDVRVTRNTVEVFYEGTRICSHVRLHDTKERFRSQLQHRHQRAAHVPRIVLCKVCRENIRAARSMREKNFWITMS